jgi:hypothetical protein
VRAAVIAELGPVLASGEIQVRLAGPGVAAPGGDSGAGSATDPVPGLVLEVRFADQLPAGEAEQRAQVIADRMSQSAALREVFDGVLAVTIVG